MNSQHDPGSHLFLVRFWSEGANEAKEKVEGKGWSGRVQHVLSGEARTFHNWHTLVDILLEMAETESIEAKLPGPRIQEVAQ